MQWLRLWLKRTKKKINNKIDIKVRINCKPINIIDTAVRISCKLINIKDIAMRINFKLINIVTWYISRLINGRINYCGGICLYLALNKHDYMAFHNAIVGE